MRAVPLLRALALPAAALLTSGACSLLAPSDAELMGDTAQPSTPTPGGGKASSPAGGEGGDNLAGQGGAPSTGGLAGAAPSPAAGEGGAPSSTGGEGGTPDVSPPISQENLELWLMADQGTEELAEGGVALWADFSPNEADARQSIASMQPKLLAAAGSVPAMLEFDGVDDQLVLPEGFGDFSAGLSIFVVASESENQSCPSLLHLSNEPEQDDLEVGRFHGSVHYEVADDDVWGPENAFPLEQRVLLGVVHSPGKVPELRLNGAFMATGSFTALPESKPRRNNFIGRSLYEGCELFHGKLGEIIVYSRALASAEREAVQLYLQAKWTYEPKIKTKPGPGQIPSVQ